ncbi:hypothetical protein [Streptomyces brevispora]|uniref:Uncharacterized protein n=1 Tax=Streptomyces brevispora TaxID=887462 RepID=A0ABZ1G501_9ACTN|nr:hypothetical protein [Streptomyces brevispora]WSC14338.1 hypothetical protein OIE64_16810 [Streptomyces brevispora]
MADHFPRTSAPASSPPDRRLIAVGILGRTAGRTVLTIRTADGVTGTVTSRCPNCRRTFEDCTCPGGLTLPALPAQQTFDDDSDDACPLCGNWTCTCPTRSSRRELAVAR